MFKGARYSVTGWPYCLANIGSIKTPKNNDTQDSTL